MAREPQQPHTPALPAHSPGVIGEPNEAYRLTEGPAARHTGGNPNADPPAETELVAPS